MVEDTDADLEAPTRGKKRVGCRQFFGVWTGPFPAKAGPTDSVHLVRLALVGKAESASSLNHLPNPKHHNHRPTHTINRLLLAGIRTCNPGP